MMEPIVRCLCWIISTFSFVSIIICLALGVEVPDLFESYLLLSVLTLGILDAITNKKN